MSKKVITIHQAPLWFEINDSEDFVHKFWNAAKKQVQTDGFFFHSLAEYDMKALLRSKVTQ